MGCRYPLSVDRIRPRFTSLCVAASVALLGLSVPTALQAGFSEPVLGVVEDWELVLNEPNQALHAPQFHTVMSPFGHLDSLFAQVTWNYRELPDFTSGGLQIQAWNGETILVEKSFGTEKLSTTAETVRWTQILQTDGAKVSFTIKNGQSTTWGNFGYPAQNMKIQGSASLPNLDGYSPSLSVENSRISFCSNRVGSLKITEVRYYGASGLLGVDTTDKVVFEID